MKTATLDGIAMQRQRVVDVVNTLSDVSLLASLENLLKSLSKAQPVEFENPSPSGDPFFADRRNVDRALKSIQTTEQEIREGNFQVLKTKDDIRQLLGL